MSSAPRRESGAKPLVEGLRAKPPIFLPNYVLIDAKRAIQKYIYNESISVRHSHFALGRGSFLGMTVAVCLDLALVFIK